MIAVLFVTSVIGSGTAGASPPVAGDPVSQVNTFIGTANGGNTFPGASAPFGMTQASPIGSYFAGWQYTDPKTKGFGHTFVSGAGCWEQGGQVSVLPVTGGIGPHGAFDTTRGTSFDQNGYAASATHDGEIGQAGYYKTRLTSYGGITVEATATTHTSVERYTFGSTAAADVLVNTAQADDLHKVVASEVRIVDDTTLIGEVRTQSFCGGAQYSTWFAMKFDRAFSAFGTWTPAGGVPGSRFSGRGTDAAGQDLRGAWVTFDTRGNRQVEVTTATSRTGPTGAMLNLLTEGVTSAGTPVRFDTARTRNQQQWRTLLNRVRPSGGTPAQRTTFATAVYHSFLAPSVAGDADGRYRGYDQQIHRADGWTYHEFFSLWDTYRAQNQLVAMVLPVVARDLARSLLAVNAQGGWLPRWGYANFDTNTQTGDPVTPYLVDLWRYGTLGAADSAAVYAALIRDANGVPPAGNRSSGRAGNPHYLARGWVQYDPGFPAKGFDVDPVYGGSATEEYALADCSLSVMAASFGDAPRAADLARRGGNWASVWNQNSTSMGFRGFPDARSTDGSWVASTPTASGNGFQEATPWQYQWMAQQDVPGMVAAMGGVAAALRRLDAFFDMSAVLASPTKAARESWVVGATNYDNAFRYNPNNEPDLHAPTLYAYMGQPARVSAVMRAAQTLYTDTPGGITGNDDLGTMSAWYVLSAMGLYPGVPGTGELIVSAPLFPRVDLAPDGGRPLSISAAGADGSALQYVASATMGTAGALGQSWTTWAALEQAGSLRLGLTRDATTTWGTTAARPTSPCAGQGVPPAGSKPGVSDPQ